MMVPLQAADTLTTVDSRSEHSFQKLRQESNCGEEVRRFRERQGRERQDRERAEGRWNKTEGAVDERPVEQTLGPERQRPLERNFRLVSLPFQWGGRLSIHFGQRQNDANNGTRGSGNL